MPHGVGTFCIKKHVNYASHRLAFQYFYGELDTTRAIIQTCGQRACVNPAHLRYKAEPEESLAARFWSKVQVGDPNACWEWHEKTRNRQGYGSLTVDGRGRRAHRLAYELTYGPIPDGLIVLHSCDNPPCCNPAHLRAGTYHENAQDLVERNEHWNERIRHHAPRGEKRGHAKLTPKEVREIFFSTEPQKELAAKYGVAQALISGIRNAKRWTHLTQDWVEERAKQHAAKAA